MDNGGSSSEDRGGIFVFLTSFTSGIVVVLAFIKIFNSGTTSSTFTAGDNDNNTNITVADTSWANMRWQPISTDDDNCLPGFQLANATIHCGVNDLSPITKDSDGSEYCGGVKWSQTFV